MRILLVDNDRKAARLLQRGFHEEGFEIALSDRVAGLKTHDELARVFERFYRGQNARTAAAPGVRLGLALTQAIVRAYGGRIEVFNQPGRGASFCVHLPR